MSPVQTPNALGLFLPKWYFSLTFLILLLFACSVIQWKMSSSGRLLHCLPLSKWKEWVVPLNHWMLQMRVVSNSVWTLFIQLLLATPRNKTLPSLSHSALFSTVLPFVMFFLWQTRAIWFPPHLVQTNFFLLNFFFSLIASFLSYNVLGGFLVGSLQKFLSCGQYFCRCGQLECFLEVSSISDSPICIVLMWFPHCSIICMYVLL